MYTCPVCGYDNLRYPPDNYTVCPSCYTEFGYDDAALTHAELRQEWIKNGMAWAAANVTPPPSDWNPIVQLKQAGHEADLIELSNSSVCGITGDMPPVSYSFVDSQPTEQLAYYYSVASAGSLAA